jgi:RimJ/RimL family protein N-acetyltransferase
MQERLLHIDTALLTKRTVVRRFRENDGELLYRLVQKNLSFLEDHFTTSIEKANSQANAEFFIREMLSNWLLQKSYSFGIWEGEKADLIGVIRITNINWRVPTGELSFFIDHDFSGKGIMTEALGAVLNFAFRQLEMEKLYVRSAMDNYASQRVVRKWGFRREGDLRDAFRKLSGTLIDVMLLGLSRTDFEELVRTT